MSRFLTLARASALLAAILTLAVAAGPAQAGTANQGVRGASRSNPLAGLPWGVYTGSADNSVYPYYARTQGRTRRLLAKIALRPQVFSFGAWYPDGQAGTIARQFIAGVTGGNPNVLAQVAIFRMDPWE